MTDLIPEEIKRVYMTLTDAHFEAYLVGGCVRNMLLGKTVKDWDLTTNATPEEILKLFPNGFYDNAFGTVGIPIDLNSEKHIVEITTFRCEEEYSDGRHPDKVTWGKTIEEDLERRDFTVNAMALKLANGLPASRQGGPTTDYSVIDPYHGQEDLKNNIIRAVGESDKRFKEDALRLMRAIRLATTLQFTIEETTWNAILTNAELLKNISGERIRDELLKILASDFPYEGIMLLRNAGLLEFIIPELLEGIGISQARPGRHHTADVFTHNLLSLKTTPAKDPIVRLATLLHDIGKPRVESSDEEGLVIFHNHEIIGAKIARSISERLRLSKKQIDKIVLLIRWHMFTVDEHITDAAVRRFIRRVGLDNIRDMIDLRIGDRLGGGTETAESWRLKLFKDRIEEQLKPAAFSINDLAIDGNDIMQELNIKPGRQVGELLQKLFEAVDGDLSKNTKEHLFSLLKNLSHE